MIHLSRRGEQLQDMERFAPQNYFGSGCGLQLMPNLGTEPNTVFNFKITGRIVQISDIVHEEIEFFGQPDEFYDNEVGYLRKEAKHLNWLLQQFLFERTASENDANIFITAKAKSPDHRSVFTLFTFLEIQMYGSWFDIVIHKTLELKKDDHPKGKTKENLRVQHLKWVSFKVGVHNDQVLKVSVDGNFNLSKNMKQNVQVYVDMYSLLDKQYLASQYKLYQTTKLLFCESS